MTTVHEKHPGSNRDMKKRSGAGNKREESLYFTEKR